jgi:REP element-mobilizing transposase RayT
VYHCLSRIVDRRHIFGPEEKEFFLENLRCYERLCQVRVLTYCLMDNHFHVLVEVPRRPEVPPSESELIVLVGETLGPVAAQGLAHQIERWREQNNTPAIARELERWYAQMWDLGRFMKMVKQRFSCWYNRRQPGGRTGTLWESRYRSILVECGETLQAMSLYIDLNPVRAGRVSDPKDYRWCGYAAAAAGVAEAREGLARMAELSSPALANRTEAHDAWVSGIVAWYRQALYGKGAEVTDETGQVVRLGFTEAQINAVRDAEGNLPLHAYLFQRVRYLSDGAILGTKAFVESVFKERRDWFSSKRRSGARRLKGLARECPLRCARALSVRPTG